MVAEIGIDFTGTPLTGTNRLVVDFEPIVNDGVEVQDIMTGTDIIEDEF